MRNEHKKRKRAMQKQGACIGDDEDGDDANAINNNKASYSRSPEGQASGKLNAFFGPASASASA